MVRYGLNLILQLIYIIEFFYDVIDHVYQLKDFDLGTEWNLLSRSFRFFVEVESDCVLKERSEG